jgi:hypothetical protein
VRAAIVIVVGALCLAGCGAGEHVYTLESVNDLLRHGGPHRITCAKSKHVRQHCTITWADGRTQHVTVRDQINP